MKSTKELCEEYKGMLAKSSGVIGVICGYDRTSLIMANLEVGQGFNACEDDERFIDDRYDTSLYRFLFISEDQVISDKKRTLKMKSLQELVCDNGVKVVMDKINPASISYIGLKSGKGAIINSDMISLLGSEVEVNPKPEVYGSERYYSAIKGGWAIHPWMISNC